MSEQRKITYHDLREEALAGKLPRVIGRKSERERFDRILNRRINNNVALIGPDGIGKTTLMYGWARAAAMREEYMGRAFIQLSAEHLHTLDEDSAIEAWYAEALAHLPQSIVFIDDLGREVYRNATLVQRTQRLYKRLLKSSDIQLVLTYEPHEWAWFEREHASFANLFEVVALKEQSAAEYARVLSSAMPRVNRKHRVIAPDSALREIVEITQRFPTLGQMPHAAIKVLDESIALSALMRRKVLRSDVIGHVIEAKTGVPRAQIGSDDLSRVRNLADELNKRVLHQENATAKIATMLQRAKLGLRNPHRPLGSFLLLGPSGVGKTETAKSVAELLFGRSESFVRFDMSEFQQDHTVQRLIGAPAGYIGFEEGGAITNALRKEPHSLVLLDEIEKAHPKVFDIFLQVLDDGRLTSGQNETVDARHAIFMATSNAGVPEILRAYENGAEPSESFVKDTLMPILAETFRLEFLNRFDSIVVFQPLTVPGLVEIAQLEIKKIEKRLSKHRVSFEIEKPIIERRIVELADPRFGARPVKRFIEETCESLLADSLLQKSV